MHIELERIIPNHDQIIYLYKQLKERKHIISHEILPSFKKHENFVMNNPYRVWFLVKANGIKFGSLYIKHDNSIGLNGFDLLSPELLKTTLDLVFEQIKPLNPLPSLRYKDFFFNISVTNRTLISNIIKIGYIKKQITFIPINNKIN